MSETPAVPSAPAVAEASQTHVSATEAVRAPVPPVEKVAEGSIMPPQAPPRIPTPPSSLQGDISAEVKPHGHENKAARIEQLLATFVGDRIGKDYCDGLQVEVKLASSNAVTGAGGEPNSHDISISFKGGKFQFQQGLVEGENRAKELSKRIQAAMQEHPAFEGMTFGGAEQLIEHEMRCQILALEPKRLEQLLMAQAPKAVTFVHPSESTAEADVSAGHSCSGAGCNTCHAPSVAASAAAVQPAEAAKAEAPLVEQPVAAAKPELPLAPETKIENPAMHQGQVVANDKQAVLSA